MRIDIRKCSSLNNLQENWLCYVVEGAGETCIRNWIAESGGLSKSPVFIVHVFSGEETLGEGYGSSLKRRQKQDRY
ncbi:BTE_HP_G0220350.mRNA.1.CDS.1 [Saccharomyces cerevisiae]|nr:BTE_HP_G0220350.mRNA.1.CDS.1 [Saccharomyces cerevisiae]CAI6426984.1 BTE_HP_G0220350.mRNA.1.CDS.1 [Saccharomyces cerevisiae]